MRKLFKISLMLIFALSSQLSALSLKAYAQDKIIAVVNNDIITQKDFDDFVSFMRMQLSKEYSGRELEEKIQGLKLDLLDKLIGDRLILQEANKEKITLDESRVQGRINEIKKKYSSDAEFQRDLTKQGLTQSDIEKKIREQMLMYYIVEAKVRRKIIVRPEEVTDFYNKNMQEFSTEKVRQFQTIALENENQASSFVYNFKSGKKLEELAARYPISVDKLEITHAGELKKEIEDKLYKLDIGEVSDPVEANGKFIIFRLENIIPPRQEPLSEVQDKIQTYLFTKKTDEELTKWLNELKAKSYIKILQN